MDSSNSQTQVNPLLNAGLTSVLNNATSTDQYVKPSVFHTDPVIQQDISCIQSYTRASLLGSQQLYPSEEQKLPQIEAWSGTLFVKNMTGKTTQLQVVSNETIQAVKKKIEIKEGLEVFRQKLIKGGVQLKNQRTLEECGVKKEEVLHIIPNMRAAPVVFNLNAALLHPKYDYDFTNIVDSKPFYRGGVQYFRPCGWRRFALRVNGKYENDNWLTQTGKTDNGEWMVSYHGSTKRSADMVLSSEEKKKFYDFYQESIGIFSTPKVEIAEQYAKTFQYEGVKYKILFQDRINPKRCMIINEGNFFMCPEIDLRPYSVLIKKA